MFTFLKFNAVSKGNASWAIKSSLVYLICAVAPMVLGIVLAAAALTSIADDDVTVLGSFRGFYCYNRRWDNATTGLITIIFFCLATITTVIFYLLTTVTVTKIVKSSGGGAASKAPKAIMVRGVMLTLTFVFTWIWFTVTAGLGYTNSAVDIQIEMVGAIIINAQPIIDAILLVTMPNVRAELV
jgi:hypothetical protein